MAAQERRRGERQGLTLVYTGDGKGKTTAALGLLMRAWGRSWRICVVQFVKRETGTWGEVRAAERMEGVDWVKTGDGFTWQSKDIDETVARARHGWELAKGRILSGCDMVILDEFTYPLAYEWLDVTEVVDWLKANKPPELHLVITGRDAPEALIEHADLVTEMRLVKHPYDDGVKAQAGIEF